MFNRNHARIFIIAGCLYFVIISIISHIPGSVLVEMNWRIWDKLSHVVEYAPLGFLISIALKLSLTHFGRRAIFAYGIVLIAVLGMIDEIHQSFVPGRFSSVGDVVADTIGGGIGIFIGIASKVAVKINP